MADNCEFRPMRRAERKQEEALCWEVLKAARYGVLSTVGDHGYPYGIPLSHVVVDGAIYFHAATEGHKLDAIAGEEKACYTAVEGPLEENVADYPPGSLGTYRSAIFFGRMEAVPDEDYLPVMRALCAKYLPHLLEDDGRAIIAGQPRTKLLRLRIEHVSVKQLPLK